MTGVRIRAAAVAGGFTAVTAAGVTASLLVPPRTPRIDRDSLWGSSPRQALVLGAGGILGAAWEMGMIARLAECGWDVRSARLIVGTSAGSLVAALLRTGLSTAALLDLARTGQAHYQGVQVRLPGPLKSSASVSARASGMDSLAAPARAFAHLRLPHVAAAAAGLMPPSGFSLEELGSAVDALWEASSGPVRWPELPTWLVAGCVSDGQRVVFGAPGEPLASLGRAVAASCAVPGALEPVWIAGRRYVDGGVVSMVNLDLAVTAGADQVWVLHPLGSRRSRRAPGVVGWGEHVIRARQARQLARWADKARARGVKVTVLSPSQDELEALGERFMDSSRAPDVVAAALARPAADVLSPH